MSGSFIVFPTGKERRKDLVHHCGKYVFSFGGVTKTI